MFHRSFLVATLSLSFFGVCPAAPTKSTAPAQTKLARAGAFSTVATAKGALPATNLAALRGKISQTVSVTGTVVRVFTPKSNARVLLNFAPNYKTAVIGLVEAKNFKQFPNLMSLRGKRVVLTGRLKTYKDQTQIELTAPGSIRIVK